MHRSWAVNVLLITTHFQEPLQLSRYSAGLRAVRSGFYGSIPGGAGNFSLYHRVQNGSGARPASYSMCIRGSFPGVKLAGAWSWPLTSSNVEVENAWSCASTPQYVFMAWFLVKLRDFTFYHLLPSSAKVKNVWSYASTSPSSKSGA
jgi:hypothetical protein